MSRIYFPKIVYTFIKKCYNVSEAKSNDEFRKGTRNDYARKHHFYDEDVTRNRSGKNTNFDGKIVPTS